MDDSRRLDMALRDLRSGDWETFEQLCSTFLSSEFADLRTIAGTGDKGRDAVLESPDHAGVVFQFSTEQDPRSKITKTVARLNEAKIKFQTLIYLTNQAVGPRGDTVQAELLESGISLFLRDRSWFVDRALSTPARAAASRELARRVVNPLYVSESDVTNDELSDPAMRAGLLYLELQLHDSQSGRNLSKLTYDALVLGALTKADDRGRRQRDDIIASIKALVPNHDPARVDAAAGGALDRLRSRKRITFTGSDDSYALHHVERQRLAENAADIADSRGAVRLHFEALAQQVSDDLEIPLGTIKSESLADTIDDAFQAFLHEQGNRFAEAVRNGGASIARREIYSVAETTVIRHQSSLRTLRLPAKAIAELVAEVMTRCFLSPPEPMQRYLRELADAYTLLAFLREADDVRDAVGHFFSRGTLVLDTTVLLPCFAETVLDPTERQYTRLLIAAREAGMQMYMTEGVANEISTHFRRCISCVQMDPSEWRGGIPLVLAEWRAARVAGDFRSFANQFTNRQGDLERIQMFAREDLGIEMIDLEKYAARVDLPVRSRISEIWRSRKAIRPTESEIERGILLRHDVEAYCGVLGMRTREKSDIYGYESWWLTGDGTGFRMRKLLEVEGMRLPSDPCMAASFLSNLLAIGGNPDLSTDARMRLPAALEIQRAEWMGGTLGIAADRFRAEHAGNPEWLVRSKTREAMNEIKQAKSELTPSEALAVVDGEVG